MKPNILEALVDLKLKVDFKDNIVDFGVSNFGDNEVDTVKYFFT